MKSVGIRELKSRLSEYIRRVQEGEEIQITSHGAVVAELRPPTPMSGLDHPKGLEELVRRGIAREIRRNDASVYSPRRRLLEKTTTQALLDEDRADRR